MSHAARAVTHAPHQRRGAEPWGLQALLQLVVLLTIGVLLWSALEQIHGVLGTSGAKRAWLLRVNDWIVGEVLPRLDRFVSPEYRLVSLRLPEGVAVWALVSILGNLFSAFILFLISARSWSRERPVVKSVGAAVAVLGIVFSVLATPFLFAVLNTASGRRMPLDAAVVSLGIFLAYFVVDSLFAADSTVPASRRAFLVFVAAVDVPCLLATGVFIACNLYVDVPPEFAIGVAAGLFTYYSLAFLLLGGLFWLGTNTGEAIMAEFRGRIATAIAVGAALNAAIGSLVQLVKLPIYLDLVGSIFVGLLYGPIAGIFAAIVGSLVIGALTTPLFIAYVATAVGVTAAATYLKRFTRYGTRLWPTFWIGGLLLGPLSSLLSVPITTYLFSGVTFTGSDLVTALFVNTMGRSLLESVAVGAFIFDAVDKALTSVLAYWLLKSAPRRLFAASDDA